MKKRSAMLMAAALVVALAVGGVAVSLGATGPASASEVGAARRQAPIVRTVTRVVTVHRRGDAITASGGVAPTTWTVPTSGSSGRSGDDDAMQGDDAFEDDDAYEDSHGEDGSDVGEHEVEEHEDR